MKKTDLTVAEKTGANTAAISFLREELKSVKKWTVSNTLATIGVLGGEFHTQIVEAIAAVVHSKPFVAFIHLFY